METQHKEIQQRKEKLVDLPVVKEYLEIDYEDKNKFLPHLAILNHAGRRYSMLRVENKFRIFRIK